MNGVLDAINAFMWVSANVILAYIMVLVVIFVLLYRALFEVNATTGGKLVYRFMVSLVGITGLIVLGTFIDPAAGREWFTYPTDVAVWRPIVRFAIYTYVAYTVTSLSVFLVIRRFYPNRVKKAEDYSFVKPRTGSIPIKRDF